MTTKTRVRYERQPLVRQTAALFTTNFGTEYQILWWSDADTIRFGTRNAGDWMYSTFRYADAWRERNGWPKWSDKTFRLMVDDFVAECDADDEDN